MIETSDVRVDYDGFTAVRDLDLTIPAGTVYGLIGPNGAGKTSTIRVLATLQEPTYGDVRICGIDALENPREVHRVLGYMPDSAPTDDDLRCWEFLDLFGAAYGLERRLRRRLVDEHLEGVGLTEKRNAMTGTLSRGMKQRLLLAKTLIPDPKVLLLDEPASGLDPIARIEMRDLLKRLGETGRTVLISSHILTELAEFCGSIGIMRKGRMVVSGPIEEIVDQMQPTRRLVVELVEPREDMYGYFQTLEHVGAVETDGARVEFEFGGSDHDAAALLRALVDHGLPVKAFHERRRGVEDIMLEIGREEDA